MSEIPGRSIIESVNQNRIDRKTREFLARNQLTVKVVNRPTYPCLIVATHPTNWDAVFWRAVGNIYHAVASQSSRKTRLEIFDLILTRMIPVYQGEKRARTYDLIAQYLSAGNQVVLNPTGITSGTNDIPDPAELKMGALYRSLQRSEVKTIVPAIVVVNGEITQCKTVKAGGTIKIIFAETPLNIDHIDFTQDRAPDDFASHICAEWQNLYYQQQRNQ